MPGSGTMVRVRGRPVQRAVLLVACVLALSVMTFLALQAGRSSTARIASVEEEALHAAEHIVELADARASADLQAMRVLAALIAGGDDEFMRSALDRTFVTQPSWRAVGVYDAASGEIRMASPRILGAMPDPPESVPMRGIAEGVRAEGPRCPCVRMFQPVPGDAGLILFAHVTPDVYQRRLLTVVPTDSIGALVDREGEFLGRSMDFENRVATPATTYVREAIAGGNEGLYRGETYEGMSNYTAYWTSPVTGWSAHIAVDSAAIDQPRFLSAAATFGGAAAALLLAGGLAVYLVHDLTRRAEDERRILELQKSEAIGEFTNTVVHDFRNLLAIMQSAVNLISRSTTDEKVLAIAGHAEKAAQRGVKLVNQLLSFARRDSAEVESVDLRSLIGGIDELLRSTLGDGVDMKVSIDEGTGPVRANGDQLELALINLASNARDAMHGRGRFAIEATRAGDMVEIRASDTGRGVPPELRHRVFEPFFTTKDAGSGTGLGLAQVAGAVTHAGGSVEVDDVAGGGAVFVLRLPVG